MKVFMDKLIVMVIMFSVAICLVCLTKFNVANGQADNIIEDMGNSNDSAYAIHNLDSPDGSNVWFNITAKVFKIHAPLPSFIWFEVHHIGDPKKPLVVYYPITLNVGSHNISKWLRIGDCIKITGRTELHIEDEQTFIVDSIDKINCAEMSTFLPIFNELIYDNKYMGIKFTYSRPWHVNPEFSGFEDESCKKLDVTCHLRLDSNGTANIDIFTFRGPKFEKVCEDACNSLLNMIRSKYNSLTENESNGFSFINDNRTTIDQHRPAWQMEYDMANLGKYSHIFGIVRHWDTYIIVNRTYYIIGYQAFQSLNPEISPQDKIDNQKYEFDYTKYLPEAKTIVNTLQFIPAEGVPPPKMPSFLQSQYQCPMYSLEFGPQWTPDDNNRCDNAHWSLSDKNGRLFILRLPVNTSSLTREDAYSSFKEKIFKNPSLSQFKSDQRTISNVSTEELFYTENSEEGFFKHLEEFVPTKGGGWIIHYYASGNDFESGLPDIERVLSSFKIVE